MSVRNMVIITGDQLDAFSSAFDGFSPEHDVVVMAEAQAEATRVWSHKARIALFLSAMRHFRDALGARGWTVCYTALDDPSNTGSLEGEIRRSIRALRPRAVLAAHPGEWAVLESLRKAAEDERVPLRVCEDRHFLCSPDEFAAHAASRRQLRMEYFYREMRARYGILMDGDRPSGGSWNYDARNRGSFGHFGPGRVPRSISFPPDAVTLEVIALVSRLFPDHPGSLSGFDWPVTPHDADRALSDFIENRLSSFGQFQDAMWTGEPFLYHSRLSSCLNLKLLDPRTALERAEGAFREGNAPLESVEGFVRQILGWREYVRGVYWTHMPGYASLNRLDAHMPLPDFYWTGDTPMRCLRECIGQTLERGYAHHIQRLMVTGLYALLLGVDPGRVHEWYLAIYVDAVEWVEMPNTLGMSQFADGGIMASKPYAASGRYIQRMSNYCSGCPFDPALAVGDRACPFTTLYWDFLHTHREMLSRNPRMAYQLRNLARIGEVDLTEIRARARAIREGRCESQ